MIALRPVQRIEARQFVLDHHRHHGWVFGFLCLHGLAAARRAQQNCRRRATGRAGAAGRPDYGGDPPVHGRRAERLLDAVRGARRTAIAKGYRRGLTYILAGESGALLRAAGWRFLWHVSGRSWHTPARRRIDKHPTEDKHAYGWGDRPADDDSERFKERLGKLVKHKPVRPDEAKGE
jgi:hypothetical protein